MSKSVWHSFEPRKRFHNMGVFLWPAKFEFQNSLNRLCTRLFNICPSSVATIKDKDFGVHFRIIANEFSVYEGSGEITNMLEVKIRN